MEDEFLLDKTVTFCNSGSGGVVPTCVANAQMGFMRDMYANPDFCLDFQCAEMWLRNLEIIAPYLGTDVKNLAFARNTTCAINAVLSSIMWKHGDVIIVTDIGYGPVRIACDDIIKRRPSDQLEVYCIDLPYPIQSEEQIVAAYLKAVESIAQSGKTPRLAIVDAISSKPAMRMPFERLTEVLSKKGVEVCIDGAHAPGQIELNLDKLGADYFAGNLHKWFYCPVGVAIFYAAPKHQLNLRGPIVSYNDRAFLDAPLHAAFYYQGTDNITSFYTVGTAVDFVEKNLGGLQAIWQHNSKLVQQAAELCSSSWGNSGCFDIPESMRAPCMLNVFLPKGLPASDRELQWLLFEKYKIWCAFSTFRGAAYARLSAQVYNKIGDFERLAQAVKLLQKCDV